MSYIKSEKTNLAIYSIILQEAISDVKQKVGISDDEIEWIIFDEKDYMEDKFCGKISIPSFLHQTQYKYGFCHIDRKRIYISTAAIMTSSISDFKRGIWQISYLQKVKKVFLVNVILDELAHIKTGKDHGDKIYETTLEKYHNAYYGKSVLFNLKYV